MRRYSLVIYYADLHIPPVFLFSLSASPVFFLSISFFFENIFISILNLFIYFCWVVVGKCLIRRVHRYFGRLMNAATSSDSRGRGMGGGGRREADFHHLPVISHQKRMLITASFSRANSSTESHTSGREARVEAGREVRGCHQWPTPAKYYS